MDHWEFLRQSDGCWTWQHMNCAGAKRESRVSFATRADCVANAIYHGYMAEAVAEQDDARVMHDQTDRRPGTSRAFTSAHAV